MLQDKKAVLTIAGSDSCGGAGIQADLKTMTALGVYGMSAVTALTAQNTCGVKSVMQVTQTFLEEQLEAVFGDIPPAAVKTGMLPSAELVYITAMKLRQYQVKKIVVDPVMVATSGDSLMKESALEVLKKELLPIASLVTPNIPEAEVLSGITIKNAKDMEHAAKKIQQSFGCAVLCKGGHLAEQADDFLYTGKEEIWLLGKRIVSADVHGTGCTLSSAIASFLAKGQDLPDAVRLAKEYVAKAIQESMQLGKGSRVLSHGKD